MSNLCIHCRQGRPVLRAADLLNPYTECLNCGATNTLPAVRYRISWDSRAGSKSWAEYDERRDKAIEIAKKGLQDSNDVAVVEDRWGIERELTFKRVTA